MDQLDMFSPAPEKGQPIKIKDGEYIINKGGVTS